jgi:putative oxidoreductase
MKIVVVIARGLLGLMFLCFSLDGFLNFLPAPPLTGLPGA